MKRQNISALVLAGALTLSLAACGGKPAETPTPAPTVPAAEDTTTPVPAVEDTTTPAPAVEDTAKPTEAVEVEPVESDAPTPKPTGTVQVSPIVTPAPVESSPAESTEPDAALTAADVYAAVSAKAGGSAMVDSSFALDAYYDLSADDLEDFGLYMPDMSANIEEIFIAKVKSGKMDTVKAACESRQKGMAEDAAFYPGTGTYVDGYKLVTNGDWLLFCVCEKPDDAVSAFHDYTK